MPRQKPPVYVWAIEKMDKRLTIPVAWILRRQAQHCGNGIAVVLQNADREVLGTDIQAGKSCDP